MLRRAVRAVPAVAGTPSASLPSTPQTATSASTNATSETAARHDHQPSGRKRVQVVASNASRDDEPADHHDPHDRRSGSATARIDTLGEQAPAVRCLRRRRRADHVQRYTGERDPERTKSPSMRAGHSCERATHREHGHAADDPRSTAAADVGRMPPARSGICKA